MSDPINQPMAFVYPIVFEVIVVGGGHAGIEAALAASRMGCRTLMLTLNCDTIGQMSCNPAIGGLGKGHLVREIDALGGEMGKTTDLTGIQFRMLNTRKGPSVRAPRAQCDKKAYQFRMKLVCEREQNLTIQQAQTTELLHRNFQVYGVRSSLGVEYHATTVVITTGTFLRGLMHIGDNQQSGGRAGEMSALTLSTSLKSVGLELGRFKTGTPPRLLRRSVDFSKVDLQLGDEPPSFFTFWKDSLFHVEQIGDSESTTCDSQGSAASRANRPERSGQLYPSGSVLATHGSQVPCYVTRTTTRTADIIHANLSKSPLHSGTIEGIGPRYCPSIEDKIVRFSEKDSHQLFIEPEGVSTEEMYLNGFSTCLPFDVQVSLIKTIVGCENAQILRPAYAVEYDFVYPTQLECSLETKVCRNLFLAGQINGTSGYEEAAAQGLIAGINAALRCQGRHPFQLQRNQAYIGVLIDDLVTKGTFEPYRMFTSRAEHRLLLRQDNADLRLSELGYGIGLLPKDAWNAVRNKKSLLANELHRLQITYVNSTNLAQLLRRPEATYRSLPHMDASLSQEIVQQVELTVKYEGYIRREESEVAKLIELEEYVIPDWVDYVRIKGLRTEARQKFSKQLPRTIGQARRIPGVTPADLGVVLVEMKRRRSNDQQERP